MYLWNTRALVDVLAKRKLSNQDEMRYLIAALILIIAFLYAPLLPCTDLTLVSAAEGLLVLGVTIVAVTICYRVNQEIDGQLFLQRFICLSVPLAIKTLLLFWSAHAIFFGVTEPYVRKAASHEYDWYYHLYEWTTLTVAVMSLALFYWRMAFHLSRIKQQVRFPDQ